MVDDRLIYPGGQDYISRNQIIGFVRGYIPFVGQIVIGLQCIIRLRDTTSVFGSNVRVSQRPLSNSLPVGTPTSN